MNDNQMTPPHPICFGTFSLCPEEMERDCKFKGGCCKMEEEKMEGIRE